MLTSALLVVLAAAAEPKLTVAAPLLKVIDIPAERAAFYTQQVANEMAATGLRVVTERDISAMLGLERQKQLIGCSDGSSSCMAELASALGAHGIVLGDVARVGRRYQGSIKVIDPSDGQPIAVRSLRANDEEGLLDALVRAAGELAGAVLQAHGRKATPTTPPSEPFSVSPVIGWVGVGLGVLALGGSGVTYGMAMGEFDRLDPAAAQGSLPPLEAQRIADSGKTLQGASIGLLIAGGVCAAAGAAVLVLGAPASVGASVVPSGAAVTLSGTWP